MSADRWKRTIALLGKEKAERVFATSVMVIGCGAVGGYALEMLARLGVGKIWAVDFDTFEESNINRQILALTDTLGRKKAEVAKERILAINPEAQVTAMDLKVTKDNLNFLLEEKPDFVIDAIDDVAAKCELIKFMVEHKIKSYSSMGAALKFNPGLLKPATLDKTSGCRLAKKLREMLKKQHVDLHKVHCVFSTEEVTHCKDENGNNILGSLALVPAAMGIRLAEQVFEQI